MSEDIEGIEKEIEIELSRISVSSFEAGDPDTEVSDEALSDSETVSIQCCCFSFCLKVVWALESLSDE